MLERELLRQNVIAYWNCQRCNQSYYSKDKHAINPTIQKIILLIAFKWYAILWIKMSLVYVLNPMEHIC